MSDQYNDEMSFAHSSVNEGSIDSSKKELSEKEAIQFLCEVFDCDPEEARLAYMGAGGDIQQAQRLLRDVLKRYVAVKCVFETRKSGKFYGGFFMLAEGKEGDLIVLNVFADYGQNKGLTVDANWEAFWKTIKQFVDEKMGDPALIAQVYKVLREYFTSAKINLFYLNTRQGDWGQVEKEIASVISNEFREDVYVSIKGELLNQIQLSMSDMGMELVREDKEEPEEEESKEEKKEKKEFKIEGLIVVCEPVVDPVSGVSPSEIEIGTPLYVKIVDPSPMGSYVAMALKKLGIPPIFRLKEKMQLDSGDWILMVNIARDVVGRMKVKDQVKLKVKVEEYKTTFVDELKHKINPKYVFIGIGIVFAILVGYIVYKFFLF